MRVGLCSEVKGRILGLPRQHVTRAAYSNSTVPTIPVCPLGYTPAWNRDPEPAEKDKGGEAGLDADGVASGNKSGKKVNLSLVLGSI